MKEIPLTKGLVALVDDEDYEKLMEHKWHAWVGPGWTYATTSIKSHLGCWHTLAMHRMILDAPKGMEVDHINADGLDNRRANIRVCSPSQNQWHQRPRLRCASQYKGVRKKDAGWEARICRHWRRISLGTFPTEELAATAYDRAARELHGEFAWLNFPDRTISEAQLPSVIVEPLL